MHKDKKPNNLNKNKSGADYDTNFDKMLQDFTESWKTNPNLNHSKSEDEKLLETARQKIKRMLKFTLNQIVKENKVLDILSSVGLDNNDIKDNLKNRTIINNTLKKCHSDVTDFLSTSQSKAWLKKLATSNGKKQDFYNELIDAILEYQNPKTQNPKTKKFFDTKQKIYNVFFFFFYTSKELENKDFFDFLTNLQNINIYDLNNNKIFTQNYEREFTFDIIGILEQFLHSYTSRSKNHSDYNDLKDIFEVLVYQQEIFSKETQNNRKLEILYEAKYSNFNLLSVYKKATELFTDEEIKILNKIFFNLIDANSSLALEQSLEVGSKWQELSKKEKQEVIDYIAETWGSIKLGNLLNQDTIEEALFYDISKNLLLDCLKKNIKRFILKEDSEKLKQNIQESKDKKEKLQFEKEEANTSSNIINVFRENTGRSMDNMISQHLKTLEKQNSIAPQNYVKYNKTVDGANIVINKSDLNSQNITQMIEKMSSKETAGKMFSSQNAPFRKTEKGGKEYYFYKLNKDTFLAGVKIGDIIYFSSESVKQIKEDHTKSQQNDFLSQANNLTKFNAKYIEDKKPKFEEALQSNKSLRI